MLEKYTHNKFIFLSVQKFIYTVHRYHFVNDPHDLWLSLQNILTLVSKIFLLLFISTYPTDYMIWHRRFDNLDWQLDPLLNVAYLYPQYWTAAYTGALFLHSQRAMKWTGWMFVWCVSVIYVFPRPFNIVHGPCLFYTRWYHDHYVFTKSYSWNFITTSFGSI